MAISYLDYKKTYGEQINNYYKKASEELNATNYKNREKELKEIEAKKNKWYNNFFKKSEAYNNAFSNFDNGYDFGDITKSSLKTLGATAKTVGASALDLGLNAVEGVANVGTGAAKLISGGVAQVADWVGQDEYANKVRNNIATKENPITAALNKAESKIDKNSIFGRTSDEVASLIGYTGGLAAGGAALGGAGNIPISIAGKTLNVPTLAAISGAGEGLTESYSKKNVSDAQAWTKALGSGAIEGITEGLFGMFGVGGSEITDQWGKQAASLFKSGIAKTLAKTGVSATGEAIEEFLSYLGNQGLDRIIDLFSSEDSAKFHDKWNWENVGEQMALAFFSAGLTQGGSTIVQVQKISNNAIREAEEELDRKLTPEEIQSIKDQITSALINGEESNNQQEETNLNSIESQIIALQEQQSKTTDANEAAQIESQINELQQQLNSINENMATLAENGQNDSLLIKSSTMSDSQIKNLADSVKAGNINVKTPEYKFAKALETKLGVKIAFKNNVKTPKGDTVNGFYNPFTNTIELNTRSGQTVQRLLTHELTHVLEGTPAMNQLSDFVIAYFGARNENLWQAAYSNLASTYFPVYGNRVDFNEKIRSEATAEILGNLINDQEFLNRLAKSKPNVFLKLYARVNELIARVTGSEKAFLKAVKAKMEIAWNEAQQTNNESSYVGQENLAYSKIVDKYENAKNTIDRKTLLEVAQQLQIHFKEGSNVFQDDYMASRAGQNENPEIINVDNLFENLNLNKKDLIGKAIDISSNLYLKNSKGYSVFKNIDTDTDFSIRKSGINDTFSSHKVRDITKLSTANKLQQIGEQGIYFVTTQTPGDKNNIKYHHFLTPVKAYNSQGNAFIHSVIREFTNDKTQKNSFYYHQFEYLDNKKGASQGAPEIGIHPLEKTPFSKSNDTINLPKSQNKVSNTNNTQNKKSYSLPLVREIQGMKTTKSEVEDAVYDKFEQMMEEYGYDVDNIEGVYLHGSRLRGTAKSDSDLDAVVFYIGNENEDDIFNTINNENNQLVIDGVKVDINPVSIDSLSEIDDYIARSEKYDQEVKNKKASYSLPLAKQLEKQGEKIMQKSIDYVNYFENYLEEEGITNPTEQDIYNSYDSYDAYDAEGSFNSDEEQAYIRTIKEYLKDRDTSYSLPTELKEDNQGRKLSKEQQELFVDSKVRDSKGRLLVMYHGSPNGTTTIFRPGTYFTANKEYADRYQNPGASSISSADRKLVQDSKTYEVYLNIKNPFDTKNNPEARRIFEEEFLGKWGNGTPLTEKGYPDWVEGIDLQEFIETEHPEFDGLMLDEGGEGGYGQPVIDRGISYVVMNPSQVKNVDNTNPTSSDDIRYSLPIEHKKDNQGHTLTKAQESYFKDSKARDDDGNLKVVYHTMTNEGKQFNEFNPVGTEHYRFGNQVVNYYTDDKEMSGSYANQRYEMADTKRITSMKQVEDYINKMNKNGWGSYRKYELIRDNGKYVLIDNSEVPNSNQTWQEVYDEANEYKKTLTAEELAQFKDMFDNEVRQGRAYDIDSYLKRKGYEFGSKQDEIAQKYLQIDNKSYPEAGIYFDVLMRDAKYHAIETFENEQDLYRRLKSAYDHIDRYQYEGYVNITNPYIVDGKGANWSSVERSVNERAIEDINKLSDEQKKELERVQTEIQDRNNQVSKEYQEVQRLFDNLRDIGYSDKTLIMDYLAELDANESRADDITLKLIQNSYEIKGRKKPTKEQILDRVNNEQLTPREKSIIDELGYTFIDNPKEINTLRDLYNATNYGVKMDRFYNRKGTYEEFQDAAKDILPENYYEESWINPSDVYQLAENGFNEKNIDRIFATNKSTNDIVKRVIELNKNGENYDGVILKNVVDYGGKTNQQKPNDLYITFNSNQFKAMDNKRPTNDPDIRYSENNEGAFEQFLEEEVRPLNPYKQESTFEDIRRKTLNPLQISKLTKEDANTTPNLPGITRNRNNDGKSKFAKNIENKVNMLSQESKDLMLNEDDVRFYDKVTNEESLDAAFDRLNKGGKAETMNWFTKDSKVANSTDVAEGWILLKQYQDAANNATTEADRNEANRSMVEVAKKLREIGTNAGQTVQAFNILNRLTPEGMVYYAQSELDEAYNNMVKNKTKEWIDRNQDRFQLSPDEVQFILDTMQEISTMEDGYEKRVKLAEIQKMMTDKLPPEKGARIKSWMRISMLFNPKTQVRNVVGNALIAPINNFGDLFASYADKLISRRTGVRTTGTVNVKALLNGFKRGAYEATNDYKKGINTRDMEGNRFEISEGKSFSDKNLIGRSLNRVEALLNYVMDAGDRVFSEAAFENSIQNQMRLNNTDEITQDMIDIAHQEALSRTWNDNNEYTKFVLTTRAMLNKVKIGGYGLGDVLIPFAKTPANLTKAIVDYSPVGLINAIVEGNNLRNSLSNGQYTAQMQHKFVQDLGKAVAGTALYILGYALAKAKISTGKSDDDKDVANFLKNTLGISSYSIKLGNKSFTYDWAQPIAAPLAITSNIVTSKNNKTALLEGITSSLNSAGSILLEQSFLQSLNDVLTDNDGIFSGLETEVLELPARAIPTLVKQIADMTDATQRQTYEYKQPVQSAINYAKSKLPGVSKTLAPKVDTMGREIQKYGGNNNIFNVFLNPANVNTQNISTAAKEIYDVYQKTGDDTIMPRVAPYYIGNGDDRVVLTPEQIASFQKTSGKIIEDSVANLTKNNSYKKLSYDDKAAVLNDIVNYSYNVAKSKVLRTDISSEYTKANEYVGVGGNIGDYYIYRNAISGLTADKDKNGKSISGSKKKKVIDYINTMNISVKLKLYLIQQNGYSTKGYRVVNGRIVL